MLNWIQRLGSKNKAVYWVLALVGITVIISVLLISSGGGLFTGGEDDKATSMIEQTPASMIWEVFIKLILVVVLLYIFLFLLRAWQGKRVGGAKVKNLYIEESVHLSPRQALHLVKVGSRNLLIGATDQNLNLIAEVELEAVDTQDEQPPQNKLKFDTLLLNALGNKPNKNKSDQTQPIVDDHLDDITK